MPSDLEASRALRSHLAGERDAERVLAELLYDDLRALARRLMARERRDHTLQPTALAHEAYVRLIPASEQDDRSRTHFLAVAARAMRQVLVDHARRREAQKRGGSWVRLSWCEPRDGEDDALEVLAVHEALERLRERSARQAELATLRFFGGLTVEEAAGALGIARDTARDDWRMARAWLNRELTR